MTIDARSTPFESDDSVSSGPFGDLPLGQFDFIMADPPWNFETYSAKGHGKSAHAHYACMDLPAIRDLPVWKLAAPDCLLWLWATNPMLPHAVHTLRAWGFSFSSAGVWVKFDEEGKLQKGTGMRLIGASEPFLIAVRGQPKTAPICGVVEGPRREHSRKPDQAYGAAETMMPGARRADLFARQSRPGWTAWGAEATKFNTAEGGES